MLNEQLVKEYLSKNVLPQDDKSNENILREIIFECADVDWNKALEVINREHPESSLNIWDNEFNGHRLSEELLIKLNKEYPDITEYEWLNRYYILFDYIKDYVEREANKNNNIVPLHALKLYDLSPRHIQITFNDKYTVEEP